MVAGKRRAVIVDNVMFWCLLGVTAFIALMHGREMYSRGRMDGIKATMGVVEAVVRAAKSGGRDG